MALQTSAPLADPAPVRATSYAARLQADPRGRRVPGSLPVFAFAVLVGTAASIYTVRSGTNLDYGDAMAHLTIARRVVDNKAPGLAQLGTVWLPLPHLLLMPLVQDMWLFRTGVAGCIVSTLCLGASATALWRTTARLELDVLARLVALLVLLANLSLLYVSTTALTEPVLIAAMLGTIAGVAGWCRSHRQLSGGELAVFAGIPAAAGVLTRYEAWPLVISALVVVVVASRRRGSSWRRSGRYGLALAAPSMLAASWWLAYNTAVYGTPVEFLTGQYSAAAFTQVYLDNGLLATKGNAGLSFAVLGWALLETAGLVALVAAGIGLLLMTWHWGLEDRALIVWMAASSTAFLLFSLTTGQHIMVNDKSLPTGAYNNRYVLSAIPWLALLAAVGVHHVVRRAPQVRMLLAAVLLVAVTAQNVWWLQAPTAHMTVIEEAHDQHVAYTRIKAAATWLRTHYDGGGILMDQTPDKSSLAPVLGIRIDEFFTRASGPVFQEAIDDPHAHARWVFMHRRQVTSSATETGRDLVTRALAKDPQFHARYRLVYAIADIGIYRRLEEWP
ncbi:hypothetical protein [Nocardioides psychrotolerans]|uniref:hypothetical protein n=1 Tax=Nocardioides psychrotolerans TaxID=1005945 RepID=UPI0031380E5D